MFFLTTINLFFAKQLLSVCIILTIYQIKSIWYLVFTVKFVKITIESLADFLKCISKSV